MEKLLGLLRIHIHRGVNLAIRDICTSDPYVVVRMAKQRLKTRVVKKSVNPVWNEHLTLSVSDPNLPIILQVYDHDTFSADDKMGDAELDIKPLMEAAAAAVNMMDDLPQEEGSTVMIMAVVKPSPENCLNKESPIMWEDGKVVQKMVLGLKNVECGELELELQWVSLPPNAAGTPPHVIS